MESGTFYFIHDEMMILTPFESQNSFYVQNPIDFGSGYSTLVLVTLFDRIYYYLSHNLNQSFITIQYHLFFLKLFISLSVPFIGFSKLASIFYPKSHPSKFAVFVISLFYSFNTYTLIYWHGNAFSLTVLITYILAPITFYYFYKTHFVQSNLFNRSLFVLLFFLMSFAVYLFAIFGLILTFFTLLIFYLQRQELKTYIKRLFVSILFYLPFLPVNALVFYEMFFSSTQSVNTTGGETYHSLQGQFLYPIMMWFSWAFYTFWQPRNIFTFTDYFRLAPSFIAPFIIYALIIFRFYRHKVALLGFVLLLVFLSILFLSKAAQPPFGEVFEFLMHYFPPFRVFRSPDTKFGFGVLFMLAVLLVYLYGNTRRKLFYFLVLAVVVIQGLPIFTGLAISGENTTHSTDRIIKITEPYKKISEFINSDDGRYGYVVPIPPVEFGNYKIGENESHFGQDLLPKLIHYPFVYLSEHSGMTKDAYSILKKGFDDKNFSGLTVFPIKYYILRNDVTYKNNLDSLSSSIVSNNKLVFKNELFTVYENAVTTDILEASGAAVTRVNPVHYEVNYSHLTQPQTITLNQNYNKNWHLYEKKSEPFLGGINYIFANRQFESSHTTVSGYANGWEIEKPGKYVIFFIAQAYFSLALVIALFYIIYILFLLVFWPKIRMVFKN